MCRAVASVTVLNVKKSKKKSNICHFLCTKSKSLKTGKVLKKRQSRPNYVEINSTLRQKPHRSGKLTRLFGGNFFS